MLTLATVALSALLMQDTPKTGVSLEEKLLGTIPEDVIPREVWFSSDGRSVLCRAQKGEKMLVLVGDSRGEEYDEVKWPSFAPDHKTVVYEAFKDGKSFIVLGDKIEGSRYEGVKSYAFARDGSLIYEARIGRKKVIVSGDQPGEGFEDLSLPRVGNDIAYTGEADGKEFLVVGRRRLANYDKIDDLTFSPDGKTLAYAAKEKGKWFMVIGGEKGASFDWVQYPVFSPDRKKVAYTASSGKDRKYFVMVGNEEGEKYDKVWNVLFSPDGKSLAYSAEVGRNTFVAYKASLSSKKIVVVGDRKSEEYSEIRNVTFSPDGKSVVFGAIKGRQLWWKVMKLE
jgi:WD40 repeat protein